MYLLFTYWCYFQRVQKHEWISGLKRVTWKASAITQLYTPRVAITLVYNQYARPLFYWWVDSNAERTEVVEGKVMGESHRKWNKMEWSWSYTREGERQMLGEQRQRRDLWSADDDTAGRRHVQSARVRQEVSLAPVSYVCSSVNLYCNLEHFRHRKYFFVCLLFPVHSGSINLWDL